MAKKIRGRNEGSIYKRSDGKWRVQISITGKRISKTFQDKSDAQVWLRKKQSEFDRGLDVQGHNLSLAEYLPKWLEAHRVSIRPNTAYQYNLQIEKHIIPNLGKVLLKDLRLSMIEQFYGKLILGGVGIRTVRYVHGVLHVALEKAVKYDHIMNNPAHGADLPKLVQKEMNVLEPGQIGQFLVSAKDSYYEALYHLAIVTGMIQGVLFGLKWTDIKWERGDIIVQRQVQRAKGVGWQFVEPKTRAGKRTVKVGEATLQLLREHRVRQPLQRAVAGNRWQEHDLIFTTSIGTPCDPSNLRKDFLKVLDAAGLPKMRLYDLRHTSASLMLNQGIPVIIASKRLGHANPSITMDTYGHLFNDMQGDVAKLMDELVTPIRVDMAEIEQDSHVTRN